MKEEKHIEITFIEDGYAEVYLQEFWFEINFDERGLPLFTKSVRQQLPTYMTEWLEKMIRKMRSDKAHTAQVSLYVEHEDSCNKFTQVETCNCNAVVRDHRIEEYYFRGSRVGRLTCAVCDASSTGEIRLDSIDETGARYWIEGNPRSYWRFDWPQKLICDDCVNKHIANTNARDPRDRLKGEPI